MSTDKSKDCPEVSHHFEKFVLITFFTIAPFLLLGLCFREVEKRDQLRNRAPIVVKTVESRIENLEKRVLELEKKLEMPKVEAEKE